MILSSEQVDGLFEGREIRHYEYVRASERTDFGLRPAYRQDGSYPVQLEPAKKATCRAKVTHIRLDGERWELTLKLDTVREEVPRFLQRSGGKPRGRDEEDQTARGYTHRPSVALQDAGEAVDDEYLSRYAKDAWDRFEERQNEDPRPVHEQLAYELERAARMGTDDRHELMQVLRNIRRLRRKNDQRAA